MLFSIHALELFCDARLGRSYTLLNLLISGALSGATSVQI